MEEIIDIISSQQFIYFLVGIFITTLIGWYVAAHFAVPRISVSKLKQLKRFNEATFEKTKEYPQAEEDIIIKNQRFGEFIIKPNGTFIDSKNKLMWMQAPWGMDWNGKSFVGQSVSLNWNEATRFFGKGAPGNSKISAVISEPDLASSRNMTLYQKGVAKVIYNSYKDWRLPTAYELDTLAFYDKSQENWRFQNSTDAQALQKQLFPNMEQVLKRKLWSATKAPSNCGWASTGGWVLMDENTDLKLDLLFVRSI